MDRKTRKKKGSVFGQLLAGYVVFAVVSVILLYLCLFGMLFFVSGGQLRSLAPYEQVDEDGNVVDIRSFANIGGWIERLDDSFRVTKVYGEKKDEALSYSMEELTEYLVTDNIVDTDTSAGEYRGFIKAVRRDGKTTYYFMKVARNVLQMSYNYNMGSARTAAAAFLVFGILFLANCLAMSAYLSRRIKKPLQRITDGMERVRAGDHDVRLDFEAQREFAQIRDTFNIMIGQIEAQQQEKRLSEEKKNRMLLEISHDIKTPVSTIKSSANALEEGLVKPKDAHRYYQLIDQKAGRVNTLVNELFLLLKMEDHGYAMKMEKTDLCEVVRQTCAEYYEEITGRGLEFKIRVPETPVYVRLDRKEFPRVIENLLGNAAKYNQTGHMAAVEVKDKTGEAEVLVRDDGDAVVEDLRPVLFDPFVRGDRARQTKGGTGLGLAIAGKIAEKHGGELRYVRQGGENVFIVSMRKIADP